MVDGRNIASVQPAQVEGIKIVETKMEGGKLIVTVEGDSISKLIEGAARRLAYEERLKHGLGQAGIEALGGTYVTEEEYKRAKKRDGEVKVWRADFRLTPMI